MKKTGMRKIAYCLLSILTIIATEVGAKSCLSEACSIDWCFSPYVGIEVNGRHLDFDEKYGEPLYQRELRQGGLFGGIQFTKNFGVELSYEGTFWRHKSRILGPADFPPGSLSPLGPGLLQQFEVKLSMDSVNLGLTGKVAIVTDCICDEERNTYLFALIGASYLSLKAHHDLVALGGVFPTEAQFEALSFRFHKKNKWVPYAMLALQQDIICNLAARIFIDWKATHMKVFSFFPNSSEELRFRDSFGYGIGLLYSF